MTVSPLLIIKENINCDNFLNKDRINFLNLTDKVNQKSLIYSPQTNMVIDERLLMPIFANPYPKAHEEESPMKSKAQRPTKKTKEQERSKERNSRESNL